MSTIVYSEVDASFNFGTYAPLLMFGAGIIRSGSATTFVIEGRDDLTLEFVGEGFVYDGKGRPTEGSATSIVIRYEGEVQATITDVKVSAKTLRELDTSKEFFDVLGKIDATGSTGNDYVVGGKRADTLSGGDGNDVIYGRGGNDRLFGGDGEDVLGFGAGKSVVDGGAGQDIAAFSSNVDGSSTSKDLEIDLRETGFQKIGAGATVKFVSIEAAFSGDGDDEIIGTAADNQLSGGGGNDTLIAGAGDDLIYMDAGNDVLRGGDGEDTLYVASNEEFDAKVSLAASGAQKTGFGKDTIIGFENIVAGSGDDKLTGDEAANRIQGGGGDDTIIGGGGLDGLYGGAGDDVFLFNGKSLGRNNKVDIGDFGDDGTDLIDLSKIDANTLAAGDDDFTFIGQSAFTGAAGQLRWEFFGGDPSRDILITGDVNGDGVADLYIQLTSPVRRLTGADFDL